MPHNHLFTVSAVGGASLLVWYAIRRRASAEADIRLSDEDNTQPPLSEGAELGQHPQEVTVHEPPHILQLPPDLLTLAVSLIRPSDSSGQLNKASFVQTAACACSCQALYEAVNTYRSSMRLPLFNRLCSSHRVAKWAVQHVLCQLRKDDGGIDNDELYDDEVVDNDNLYDEDLYDEDLHDEDLHDEDPYDEDPYNDDVIDNDELYDDGVIDEEDDGENFDDEQLNSKDDELYENTTEEESGSDDYWEDQRAQEEYEEQLRRQEEREDEKRRAREKEEMRRLFDHYRVLLVPFYRAQLHRLLRLAQDPTLDAAVTAIGEQPVDVQAEAHAKIAERLAISSDQRTTPVAAAAEQIRELTNLFLYRGGRSEADRTRFWDMTDCEGHHKDGRFKSCMDQRHFDAKAAAHGDNLLETWEALPSGGFRLVALALSRDNDWLMFVQEFEETECVPKSLASHGSPWAETKRVGPSLEGGLLVGPLPPHWMTGGVDPATDDTPTCHVQ